MCTVVKIVMKVWYINVGWIDVVYKTVDHVPYIILWDQYCTGILKFRINVSLVFREQSWILKLSNFISILFHYTCIGVRFKTVQTLRSRRDNVTRKVRRLIVWGVALELNLKQNLRFRGEYNFRPLYLNTGAGTKLDFWPDIRPFRSLNIRLALSGMRL